MPRGYGLTEATKDAIWELRAQGLSEREIGRRLGLLPEHGEPATWRAWEGSGPRRRRRAERCLTPRRARGDLARDRPRRLGPRDRPRRSAAPTRRSPVRSTAAAGGGATAPTPPSARPGGGRGGRGRPSSSSAPSFAELVVERLRRGPLTRSRSRAGCGSHTPTMRRCRSPTRRSTAPSTSRRGGRCKRELTRHLQNAAAQRRYARSQSSKRQGQGKLTEMVMISERPPEVEDRAVPGHWEGDLLMGTPEHDAIATLVERRPATASSSPCPRGPSAERGLRGARAEHHHPARPASPLADLGPGHGDVGAPALLGRDRRRRLLLRSPKPLAAGLEREHQRPASPVLPEGQEPRRDRPRSASTRSPRKLNGRPRKTLGFRTPAEKLTELIDGPRRRPAPSADLASAYGLRSTALGPDGTMRNVRGGALTG